MKTFLYIIIIAAVIGGGAYAWIYFSKRPAQIQSSPTASLPEAAQQSSAQQTSRTSYSITDTFPKTDTISIGTGSGSIEVKNFYKSIVDTEEGMVIMRSNENYKIIYDRNSSIFYIYMFTGIASQPQAENDLISILNISQQDACKLNVFVFQAGQQTGTKPSFCAGQ